MDNRTKTLFSSILCGLSLTAFGCGYSQPSRFQNSFLPPAPKASIYGMRELADPPAVQPNVFLQDVPFLKSNAIPRSSRGDSLLRRADQAFQRGKAAYQTD